MIVYPNGATKPPVASITFAAKQTIANLSAVKIGSLGRIESSRFTVINPTAVGTGIYSISSTTVRARNVEVGHAAPGGWALHSYNASRLEFADGYANGAVRRGPPTPCRT